MGAFESGQSFLDGVLAKLPEKQREAAEAIFKAAEAKDAVTLLGDGALARSDYSRSMDQLREKEGALNEYYTRLNSWYADNQTALERAVAAGGGNPQLQHNPQLQQQYTPEQLAYLQQQQQQQQQHALQSPAYTPQQMREVAEQAINEAGRDYIAVSAFIAQQGLHHLHMFGEPLDAMELVQNPKLGKPIVGQPGRVYSLQDAYQEKYGERLQAKQKETEEKRFNDEVEKRLQERQKANASHPFPLRNESSPLDVLASKDGPGAHTLDTAVAEYERLQSARGG